MIWVLPILAKDKEIAKTNKAVVEMANDFTLGVDEDGMKELLNLLPEELTTEELLELEKEHIAEEVSREKETIREVKGRTSKKISSEGCSRIFCRSQQAP